MCCKCSFRCRCCSANSEYGGSDGGKTFHRFSFQLMSGLHIPQSIDCFAQFQGFASLNWVNPLWAIKTPPLMTGKCVRFYREMDGDTCAPCFSPKGFVLLSAQSDRASGFPTCSSFSEWIEGRSQEGIQRSKQERCF